MNFITQKNCPIWANFTNEATAPNTELDFFAATEASLSLETSLEPSKIFGQSRTSDEFNVNGAQSSKFSFSYYPMCGDNSVSRISSQTGILNATGDFLSGWNIRFGQFDLKKCYLSNLEIKISPQEPILFSANFDVYDVSSITGSYFSGVNSGSLFTSNGSGAYLESLHALAIGVSGNSASMPESKAEISISHNCNRSPVYGLGSTYPSTVILEGVERTTQIRGENVGQIIDFSGEAAFLSLAFNPFSYFVTGGEAFNKYSGLFEINISGRVTNQNLSINAGDGNLNGNLTIRENLY